jgi:putative chitinase
MNINKIKLPDKIANYIPDIIVKYDINTNLRLAHFLAQVHYESAGFTATEENLNYSSKRLLQVFPKYFKTVESTNKYTHQPMYLASYVYGNRMGNGDEASNDGWTFRGRGYMQLTGKNNYIAFDKSVDADIINNPDLVSTDYALISAAWYWNSRKLNNYADVGAGSNEVKKITSIINGGLHGFEQRNKLFNYYYKLFNNA